MQLKYVPLQEGRIHMCTWSGSSHYVISDVLAHTRDVYQIRFSNTPFPIAALFDFIGRNSQYREKEKHLIFYNNKYWFHLMCVKSSCAITQPCTYLTNWFQIIKLYSAKWSQFRFDAYYLKWWFDSVFIGFDIGIFK